MQINSEPIKESQIIAAIGYLGSEFEFDPQEIYDEYGLTTQAFKQQGMNSLTFINTGKSVSVRELSKIG